jgi:hypothetical protein
MSVKLTRFAALASFLALVLTGTAFGQEAYRTTYNPLTGGGYYHSTAGYNENTQGYYHATTGYNSYTGAGYHATTGYNAYTGGYHAGSEEVNRYGTETEGRTYHNPYTGTTAHVQESYNPYTGRRSVSGGAYRR